MSEKRKNVKYCIVPQCTNTSVTAPEKIYICLPSDVKQRRAWQRAMQRSDFVSNTGTRFCCEDHFNVEEDIENYLYIKLMKSGRVRLKPGVIPHIFDCQNKLSLLHAPTSEELLIRERERKAIIEEILRENSANEEAQLEANNEEIEIEESPSTDRGVQVNLKPHRRSKSTQCR